MDASHIITYALRVIIIVAFDVIFIELRRIVTFSYVTLQRELVQALL